MRQFKSDGRYKFHNLGFTWIVEFRWSRSFNDETKLFRRIADVLVELHGPERDQVTDIHGYSRWKYNDNFRVENNRRVRRCRIYLKNEVDLSYALLKVGG